MSVLSNAMVGRGSGGGGATGIERSVRLRASASAYFSRTFGTPTSNRIKTLSMWLKRGALGSLQYQISAINGTGCDLRFDTNNTLRANINGNTTSSTAVFRDPTEWLHLVWKIDVTQASPNNSIVYVNNVAVISGSAVGNTDIWLGGAYAHTIGEYVGTGSYLDGHITEVYFIDGQALTPSYFGQTDSNGIWVPKAYTGTYGNNGFYLNFRDASAATAAAIGKDSSGNGNNWTPNNISVTAGATYDSMYDYPVNGASGSSGVIGCYATLNPLYPSAANISYGNLRSGTTAVRAGVSANTGIGHYWEVTAGASTVTAGVVDDSTNTNTTTVTANKVFGFRLTAAGALDYINITDAGSWTSITTGLTGNRYPYGTTAAADWNFGQRPFSGTPSGYSLCTANLPSDSVITSGSFTGNANADGICFYAKGSLTALTINGNAVTFGTHADKLATGFKLRTASASYNASGTNTFTATAGDKFANNNRAQSNP